VSGDTVLIGDGHYYLPSTISIGSKAITIQSFNGNGYTVLDGGYPTKTNQCISVQNSMNCHISGLTIINGCSSASSGGGVSFSGEGGIDNCVFSNNSVLATGAGGGLSVLAAHGPDAVFIVSDCLFISNRAPTSGGADLVRSANGKLIIDRCIFRDNVSSGDAGAIGGTGSTIRNCLVYANTAARSGSGINGSGLQVQNCTLVNNHTDWSAGTAMGLAWGNGYNCIIYNNTAWTDKHVANYDLYQSRLNSSCTTPQVPDSQGSLNFTLDPLFVNAATNDFRLQASSQCINTGTNQDWMATSSDFLGNPRIVGGIVDRGAYEYPSGSSPINPVTLDIGLGVEIIWNSQAGVRYWIQASSNIVDTNSWQSIDQRIGNGGEMNAVYSAKNQPHRFFRVVAEQ
jgi:hypothetical protein